MAGLRAGLVIRRPDAAATLSAMVEAAEQGLPRVWSTVGGTAPDALTLFAAAAVQTSRLGFGTSIVPTYPRHPVVLATQVLTVATLAPGRLQLGVGPSHRPIMQGIFGLEMGKPLDHLREYVTVLRRLLWEGASDFEGEYFQVHARLLPGTEPPRVPILISALRGGSFRLAGEIADGAISWVCPIPYLLNVARPALEAGARAAGRPTPQIIAHVPVALHQDLDQVRVAARQQLATYGRLPFYQRMFQQAGFPVDPDGTLPDALLDELVVAGSAEAVETRLRAIHDAGMSQLIVSPIAVADAAAEEAGLIALLARAAS